MTDDEIRNACADIANDIENGERFLTNSDGSAASYLCSIACSLNAIAKCDLLRIKDDNLRNAEEEARARRSREERGMMGDLYP